MSELTSTVRTPPTVPAAGLQRRLVSLRVGVFLQGFWLWVPVEKLFMTEIGFDAATIGLMAAAYAAVVPLVEVFSGVLADRWSRRGVLILSGVALLLSVLVAGLSQNVTTYIVAALILGVYFAMYSGTVEAMVYDTVLEETGSSTGYEKELGRIRVLEGTALVLSALAGGWLAEVTSSRLTYFLTLPFTVGFLIAVARFREPRLHQLDERRSLREHLRVTVSTVLRRGRLVPIAVAAVGTAVILQGIFEFGPLWLIDLSSAAVLYGPFWAGLMLTLSLGGFLAGRLHLDRRPIVAGLVVIAIPAAVVLSFSRDLAVLTAAMMVLATVMVVAGIHVNRLLHDAVDSTVRTGVASGVSALSWMVFLPFALTFGAVSKDAGVHSANWLLVAVTVLAGAAISWVTLRPRSRSWLR
ncbi:putative MFS family arabinose efflux permease [Kribbella amoyensis]|uniref:Putative MFS family arabinose efflux permease n=1 Tax=Kribbella amoyensis TaxID=996641 RepID=A0A561BZK1_9ACTN|nr:MFS transporter [Kribbella amoyensis]TWD84300.1 putative MFS family arabinose efflux permease [Kribbella amoyensis]